jgi:hypothetical protein
MKIFSFLFIFSIAFFNFGWTQTEDSISNLGKPEGLHPSLGERFEDEIIDLFSSGETISSSDIDNSIVKSFGDILKRFRFIDVTSYGIYGQPEIGTVFGGTSQQIPIYIDGIPFNQQSLYFPQTGDFDLHTVPINNIDTIKVIDGSVINILGRNTGIGGLEVKQKDYYGGKAFSRAKFQSGPNHYRHTQIDLGRGLTSKGRFYLTGDFRKYGGTVPNSDLDSRYLTGKFTFNLKKNWEIKFNTLHFHTDMGIAEKNELIDLRKNQSDWRLNLNSSLLWRRNSRFFFGVYYSPGSQKMEQLSPLAFRKEEKKEKTFLLKAQQETKAGRHYLFLSGYLENQIFKQELWWSAPYWSGGLCLADLFKLSDRISFLFSLRGDKFGDRSIRLSSLGGLSLGLRKDLILFTTVSKSSKSPTLHDLYLVISVIERFPHLPPQRLPHPRDEYLLKDENVLEANCGIKLTKKKYQLKGSLVGIKIKNDIVWEPDRYPVNRDRDVFGGYLSFNLTPHPNFEAYLSYAYKNSQYKIGDSKYFVPFMPRHSAYSYLQYKKEFLKKEMEGKIRLEGEYLSERYLQYGEKDSVPSVFILNSKISLRFLDFHFYYVVENITDQKYRTRGEFFMPERTFWWGFYWNFWD